ncbi:signal peptidase II (plasmid) [Arthrobacter sp. FW305-123]|nr:signal peptidase II [Arthrobacter sp. FW305-123]
MSAEPTARPGSSAQRARRIKTILLVAAVALAAADLAIKALAEAQLGDGTVIDLGLVNIRLLYNTGVAFSLGATLSPWIVVAATAVIVAALAVFLYRAVPGFGRLSRVGAALLLGGALGNMVDRMDGAGVVDYLHSGWFPTFNLADVFVVGGVGLLVLGSLRTPAATQEDH